MEKAIFINRIDQLKNIKRTYDRIYFGAEFCERLIPSENQLKKILGFINKKNLNFSLVTPYVTNCGLYGLERLFKFLKSRRINCEVIVNDWGVLNLINHKYPNLIPVLGRLLTKQKRGPTLNKLLKSAERRWQLINNPQNPKEKCIVLRRTLPRELTPYYKGSNVASVPVIHDFLNRYGIHRIELDNTAQGVMLELPQDRIRASVYLPYAYITTTFFCPTIGCAQKTHHALRTRPCQQECKRYAFKLRNRTMSKVIYLKGNTQFYKNNSISIKLLDKSGIDRVIYSPEL